jgi:hypothetical protein
MPALANQKHELFCRNLIEGAKRGWSATEAYIRAGYSDKGVGSRVGASRLLTKDYIKRRLAELNAPAVRKTQITLESLLTTLEANIIAASEKGQHGAVNGSVALIAQLRGMLINKTEIGGPGEFDGCDTVDKIIAKVIAETDDPHGALAVLDELREALIDYLANHAVLFVENPEPLPALSFAERWQTAERASGELPGYTKHGYR